MHSRARFMTAVAVLGVSWLLGATPTRATIHQGILLLQGGRADCQSGQFASGVKKMLDAAVVLQRVDEKHPANRQWLPEVRRCLQRWVTDTANTCRREGRVEALEIFNTIEAQVKYLAAPVVKRMLATERPRCGGAIVSVQTKACLVESGRASLDRLDQLLERLKGLGVDSPTLTLLAQGKERCAGQWLKEASARCDRTPEMEHLRDIGVALGRVGARGRGAALGAYERCAKVMGARAWSVCQSRRYQEGRAMLVETIQRYGFFPLKDRAFLETMQRQWLPQCGTWLATGFFRANLRRGATDFSIEARITLELARTGQGEGLVGALRAEYTGVTGKQQGCRVLITPTDGQYSLVGTEDRAGASLQVGLEKGRPHTRALEEIQITCGEKLSELSKGRFLHQLLQRSGLFSPKLSTRSGASASFRHQGDLPGGVKGSFAGTLVTQKMREPQEPGRPKGLPGGKPSPKPPGKPR